MIIGIDAGGTKTDICLGKTDGQVLARGADAGINAARLGARKTAETLARRLEVFCPDWKDVRAIYAGVAGAGTGSFAREVESAFREALKEKGDVRVAVRTDAFSALNAHVGFGDGIALTAGTGSSAFLRKGGLIRRVGGLGPFIDDAGGGFWLGRACLNEAGRALDGRGGSSALLEAVENRLGRGLVDALPDLYAGGVPEIASFAPLVFSCAEGGDRVSQGLVASCARELGGHLRACVRGMEEEPLLCVASGGMFRREKLVSLLREEMRGTAVRLVISDVPPVCGAMLGAACLIGDASPDAFRSRFRESIRSAFFAGNTCGE